MAPLGSRFTDSRVFATRLARCRQRAVSREHFALYADRDCDLERPKNVAAVAEPTLLRAIALVTWRTTMLNAWPRFIPGGSWTARRPA
jgi:hypothetical protein